MQAILKTYTVTKCIPSELDENCPHSICSELIGPAEKYYSKRCIGRYSNKYWTQWELVSHLDALKEVSVGFLRAYPREETYEVPNSAHSSSTREAQWEWSTHWKLLWGLLVLFLSWNVSVLFRFLPSFASSHRTVYFNFQSATPDQKNQRIDLTGNDVHTESYCS